MKFKMNEKKNCLVDKLSIEKDPLLFYQVMSDVGRFEVEPDQELEAVCAKVDLRGDLQKKKHARERMHGGIKDLLLGSKRPSLGFRWVKKIGRLQELFPELDALVAVEQNPEYHPEKNLFEHTMQSLDAAAQSKDFNDEERFMILLTMLCHDFGKTKIADMIKTEGHGAAGVPLAKMFLERFVDDTTLVDTVCALVRHHMVPLGLFAQKVDQEILAHVARELAPKATLRHLFFIGWSDIRGRNKDWHEPLSKGVALTQIILKDDTVLEKFMTFMKDADFKVGPEKPILYRDDFSDSVQPGLKLWSLVKKAYQIQIDEDVKDPNELKRRVIGS